MPTLKTAKGVKKRIKVTGTGKLLAFPAGRRHLLAGRPAKLKRQARRPQRLVPSDAKKIRALLPYQ
ncbi:MAG: 50S ribosomal protein L35 [Candidatus Omnitrophica bacterium]|nr:50S ribosomal protein L35 [Candidatus Omnitrophota bacterium]